MGGVMIMAGGTGGHVFPALALAEELRARGREIFWLGVPGSFEPVRPVNSGAPSLSFRRITFSVGARPVASTREYRLVGAGSYRRHARRSTPATVLARFDVAATSVR